MANKNRRFRKRSMKKQSFSKRVMSVVNTHTELKTKQDTEDLNNLVVAGPFIHDIGDFGIVQGLDNDEHIGDKIRIKDYSIKIRMLPGSSGYDTTDGHTYRITAIQELGNQALSSANIPGPLDFWPNAETADLKYKILFDKTFRLNPDVDNNKYHTLRISGKNLKEIVFDDGASTVSQNNVRIFVKPINSTANKLKLNSVARIRYYDL